MVVNDVVVVGGVVVVSGFRLTLHRLSLQQPPAKPDPLFPKVFVETDDIWPQSYRIKKKMGSLFLSESVRGDRRYLATKLQNPNKEGVIQT